jgi:phosphoribosylformylglycinamidine synthase
MKARVTIYLKDGILDVQGQTIQQALASLGFTGVQGVRAGKSFEVELASMPPDEAKRQLSQMCDRLLVNPTIEKYQIELG